MITEQEHLDWVNNPSDDDVVGKPIHRGPREIYVPVSDDTELSSPVLENTFGMMKITVGGYLQSTNYVVIQFTDCTDLPRDSDNQLTLMDIFSLPILDLQNRFIFLMSIIYQSEQ